MNEFKKILPFALPYKKYAFLNIGFNVVYALFSTLSFIAMIPVLKVIFNDKLVVYKKPVYDEAGSLKDYLENYLNYYLTDAIATQGSFTVLMYMIAVIIAIFMLKNLFNYWAMYFSTFIRNGILIDMRTALYKKITSLPLGYYSKTTKGDVISKTIADVNEISGSYLSILEMAVREPMTILFTLAAMIFISFKLTLFVLFFIPISAFIISQVGKTLKKNSTIVQQEQGKILSILEETLGGLRVIKSFTAEEKFRDTFQATSTRYLFFSNKVVNRQNLASPLSEFLGIVVIGTLLVFGGYLVFVKREIDAGVFLGYIMLAYNVLTPAKAISKASYGLKRGNASAERVIELLEQPNPITSKPDAVAKHHFDQAISIKNVTFKYEDEAVLHDFSLEIPKGQTVALVGQSGSGKSTIANLLTRFYDVNEGAISIDGIDIREIELQSLRGLMGLVTQDSILFNDTVRNNIALGKLDATDEEIIDALKIANAYEFVKDLPLGIETNIGDSGNKLSGGQKQRLSIARAVLKNPPVMILDEATSALDTESERLVQQALENMMLNRTSIVIAHRLSTIQKADKIVVMQRGRIVEQGTHEQLIAIDGTYRKLVMMQSFE
ncbi:MAG TPA: ABC transporter ATP-binding protein [Flavobacterium sp.]|jgi:subfamily B ATP-binding cassette protein MsbA